MQDQYLPAEIETTAQNFWDHNQSFKAVEDDTRDDNDDDGEDEHRL